MGIAKGITGNRRHRTHRMVKYGVKLGKLLYENALSCEEDIAGFILEGSAKITFEEGRMRLENVLDPVNGQKANYVLWCPEEFPGNVLIEWQFRPLKEPGLAMLFLPRKEEKGRIFLMKSWPGVQENMCSIITVISMLSTFPISEGKNRMKEPFTPAI